MAECMAFAKTADEFIGQYKFTDTKQEYTNGAELIPVFRVKQMMEHYFAKDNNVPSKWIPVTERLPEIYDKEPDWSVTVLFRTTQGHIHSGYRNIGRPQRSFYDDDWTPPYWLDESENLSFEEDEVTHWMPLPEAPKGE